MTRPRSLSPEDRILWERVKRTVRPRDPDEAKRDAQRFAELMAEKSADDGPQLRVPARKRADQGASRLHGAKPATHPVPQPTIDPAIRRRIAKGRIPVEATVDLHGMTQDEAHALLRGFVPAARQRGLRTVIIVTGKGSAPRSDGVLRRMVPQWLLQPGLRDHVSGFEAAERGHGGEGALYVRLKPRRDTALHGS